MLQKISFFVGILCLSSVIALAQSRPTAPITITVNTTSHENAVPIDFSGLGFERGTLNSGNAGASGYIFSPTNTQLVTLFQNLSIKSLRIGGGSVDDEIPVGTGSDGYLGIDNLFGFAEAAGVKVLYSLRLLNPAANPIPNLMADDAAAAQHISQNYARYLSSFALGNEPDFHSYHTYTNHLEDPLIYESTSGVPGTAYPSYLADWRNFASTILESAPDAKFSGPDTGAYNSSTYTPNPTAGVSWTQQLAEDEKSSGILADATQHYYVGGSPGSTTAQQAIDNMLSADWVNNTAIATQPAGSGTATTTYTPYPWLYTNNLAPVAAIGVPYRLTESNDYLTGVPGASNGFASALWTLDYMHWWAEHDAAGVNFHNKQWIYTDTIVPGNLVSGSCSPAPCANYQTAPKGYGIKAFDLGGHGYAEPVAISNPNNINLTTYAVGEGQDVYVTIINKTQSLANDATDATVTIQPQGFKAASAAWMSLAGGEAGDATVLTATLGGAAITNNSRWLGKWMPLPADIQGTVQLTVPAATAAVVKIHAASRYAGPIQINQNGALEVFGTNGSGEVEHDWQQATDVPNSDLSDWSDWTDDLGGVASVGGVAVAKNENNTLEILVPTTAGDVYHNWQLTPGGAWNGWVDMGAGSNGITNLQVANNADSSLSVFGIGINGDLWYASESAPEVGWSDWSDLSGVNIKPGFAVGQNLDGRLDVFGVDNSGNAWYNGQTDSGGWGGWTQLPGVQLDPHLALARNVDGRLEVFGLAANGDLWHDAQQTPGGTWGGWSDLNLKMQGVPPGLEKLQPGIVAGQYNDGRLVVFGVGRGTRDVWTVSQQTPGGSWGDWVDLQGTNMNPELVVSNTADGRIQLFGIGSNKDVWSNWQLTSGGWNGWVDFGGRGITFYPGQ